MKPFLNSLILFFPIFLQSQNFPIDQLLLTKEYTKSQLLSKDLYYNNFSQKHFISKQSDSVNAYKTFKDAEIWVIDKEVGSCLFLNFKENDYSEIVDKLNLLVEKGYTVFENDNEDEYKSYLEFTGRGLIVITVAHKHQIVLISMNTCVFPENKRKIIKNIRSLNLSSSAFVFNCGGKQLFEKIK